MTGELCVAGRIQSAKATRSSAAWSTRSREGFKDCGEGGRRGLEDDGHRSALNLMNVPKSGRGAPGFVEIIMIENAGVAEFRWNPQPLKWIAGLLVLVSGLGFVMTDESGSRSDPLGLLWTAAFLWCAWRVYSRVWDRDPVVTVSAAGLFDRRIRRDVMAWSTIAQIEPFEAESTPFIGIEFHDPKAALADAKAMFRLSAPLQRLMRLPSASMQMSLLDGSGDELIAAIERFAPGKVRLGS